MTRRFHRTTTTLPAVFLLAAILSLIGIAVAKSIRVPVLRRQRSRFDSPSRRSSSSSTPPTATQGFRSSSTASPGGRWRSPARTGGTILEVEAEGRLQNFGLTELFSESSEPPFDVFPLEMFKELFPEGRYTYSGTTVKGQALVGEARLSHDIPDGPEITSPADGARGPATT
jgi:hypothetical protein